MSAVASDSSLFSRYLYREYVDNYAEFYDLAKDVASGDLVFGPDDVAEVDMALATMKQGAQEFSQVAAHDPDNKSRREKVAFWRTVRDAVHSLRVVVGGKLDQFESLPSPDAIRAEALRLEGAYGDDKDYVREGALKSGMRGVVLLRAFIAAAGLVQLFVGGFALGWAIVLITVLPIVLALGAAGALGCWQRVKTLRNLGSPFTAAALTTLSEEALAELEARNPKVAMTFSKKVKVAADILPNLLLNVVLLYLFWSTAGVLGYGVFVTFAVWIVLAYVNAQLMIIERKRERRLVKIARFSRDLLTSRAAGRDA
jgi:hypothetical protein